MEGLLPALKGIWGPMRRLSLPGTLLLLCLNLFACAGKEPAPAPAVALAVDGPRLALFGEYANMFFTGSMDRTCMAGYGSMRLEAVDSGAAFVCTAEIDSPPTRKGRVRGVLHCTGGRELLFSLRNIGPDQGVGVGRESPEGDLLVLFYHASPDEAARRFPAVKADILAARAGGT
jgi:hypothetical protein